MGWVNLTEERDKWRTAVNAVLNAQIPQNAANCWGHGFECCLEQGCSSLVFAVCVGSGLRDGLITPSEESYRLWGACQIVCDLQNSTKTLYVACQFSKIHIFTSYFCRSHFNITCHSAFIVPSIFHTCISNQNIFATSAHCCLLHLLGVNDVTA